MKIQLVTKYDQMKTAAKYGKEKPLPTRSGELIKESDIEEEIKNAQHNRNYGAVLLSGYPEGNCRKSRR